MRAQVRLRGYRCSAEQPTERLAGAERPENLLKDAASVNPIRMSDFDKNPMLFNCENGTIDLNTCTLYSHNPDPVSAIKDIPLLPLGHIAEPVCEDICVEAAYTDFIDWIQEPLRPRVPAV